MSAGSPLKIGLIGVGMHAREILIPALERLPDALRLVALATAHAESARKAEEVYRLPCHVGHAALLADPNVEAVIIASHDHEAHAIAALEAGKHVFNETPAIASREGAARIRRLARERRLIYQVGHCLRYTPVYQKMKRLLVDWRAAEPGPRTFTVRYYPYIGHFYNLLLFLAGDVARLLHFQTADASGAVTLLQFANSDIGTVTATRFHNDTPPCEQVEVTHLGGRLVAEEGRLVRFHRTPAERTLSPTQLEFDQADALLFNATYSIPYGRNIQLYMRGYVPELEAFAASVRTGEPPLASVDEAEKTMLINQAVQRSHETGAQWANVEPLAAPHRSAQA